MTGGLVFTVLICLNFLLLSYSKVSFNIKCLISKLNIKKYNILNTRDQYINVKFLHSVKNFPSWLRFITDYFQQWLYLCIIPWGSPFSRNSIKVQSLIVNLIKNIWPHYHMKKKTFINLRLPKKKTCDPTYNFLSLCHVPSSGVCSLVAELLIGLVP